MSNNKRPFARRKAGAVALCAAFATASILILDQPHTNAMPHLPPEMIGTWSSGGVMDMVGIHAGLMKNGKIMTLGYESATHFVDEIGRFQLWDPQTRQPIGMSDVLHGWNPFCAGHCFLGDGRFFVAGGFKFGDPARSSSADQIGVASISGEDVSWDRSFRKMEDLRWYPTLVTTGAGDCYVIGGSGPFAADNWKDLNEDVEYFSLANNYLVRHNETQRQYPNDGNFPYPPGDQRQRVADGKRMAGLYPFAHLLPTPENYGSQDGLLFVVTESFARLYDPANNQLLGGIKEDVGGFRTWWTQGSSVLLPIDIDQNGQGPQTVRVMLVGGGTRGDNDANAPALAEAKIYEYNVARQTLHHAGTVPLNRPRIMGDSILLPDGSIALVGGAEAGYSNENNYKTLTAELLTPVPGGSWQSWDMATATSPRGYHATALLMPDGAVFVAGGNDGWSNAPVLEYKDVEVFDPPYKHLATPAPIIQSAPDELSAGDTFTINAQGDVEPYVVLVRHGSRTHSLDTDQRMLRLHAQKTNDGEHTSLTFTMPRNRTYAPPGPYMMFVLENDPSAPGPQNLVPSASKHVMVTNRATCQNETASMVRITVQTGSDDLRGGSDNASFRFFENGTPMSQVIPLNRGDRWEDYSIHSVEEPLVTPRPISALRQMELSTTFSGGIGGDNWNVNRITVEYFNGTRWKHLHTETGSPLARLTGDYTTWRGTIDCSGAASTPGMTNAIRVEVKTGGDDLRSGSQAWASVLDASDQVTIGEFALNGGAEWPNHSTRVVDHFFPAPVDIADLVKFRIRTNMSGGISGDNWDLECLKGSFQDHAGNWIPFFDECAQPLNRFTGRSPNWVSGTPPATAGTGPVQAVRIRVKTGGDDLRDRAWFSVLDASGTAVIPEFPSSGVSGWGNGSTHEVIQGFSPTSYAELADLKELRIRTNFGGGIGGDNWNIDEVTFEFQRPGSSTWEVLRQFSGAPLVRLTGSKKSWTGTLSH